MKKHISSADALFDLPTLHDLGQLQKRAGIQAIQGHAGIIASYYLHMWRVPLLSHCFAVGVKMFNPEEEEELGVRKIESEMKTQASLFAARSFDSKQSNSSNLSTRIF
ncbi:hypothetical protein T06_6204 [Trichinella sp. T6]|nr:hypothetical protein T06_6204 [Trichinella sp. T6]